MASCSDKAPIKQDPCIFFGYTDKGLRCAVKTVRQGSEEALIYQRLQREPLVPSDHILPCEIIGLEDEAEPLLVFPYVRDSIYAGASDWPLSRVLGLIYQILEVNFPVYAILRLDLRGMVPGTRKFTQASYSSPCMR